MGSYIQKCIKSLFLFGHKNCYKNRDIISNLKERWLTRPTTIL